MFEVGREYHRKKDIHEKYKGQAQGGISTPKNYPFVFLFTSMSGEQHGYRDEYHEGIFWYTGEGQVGDMSMDGGNGAILRHSQNGKSIHLFEYVRKAYVRYVGEAQYIRHHEQTGLDREGNSRRVYVFHLDIDSVKGSAGVAEPRNIYDEVSVASLKQKSLAELRDIALTKIGEGSTPKRKQAIAYYRSEALKKYVRARAKGFCEGCGEKAPFSSKSGPFLECHHLHRMADGGPDHPENVVALCPNCHRRVHYALDSIAFSSALKAVSLTVEGCA